MNPRSHIIVNESSLVKDKMLKILYTIEKCAPRHQQGATHNLESTRVYNFLFLYNAVMYNPSLCVSFEAAKSDCYTRFIMPACRDRITSGGFIAEAFQSIHSSFQDYQIYCWQQFSRTQIFLQFQCPAQHSQKRQIAALPSQRSLLQHINLS